MRILIDMDNVISDFERGFLEMWREKYPHNIWIPIGKRQTFYPTDQYPPKLKEFVEGIYLEKGFHRSLKPVDGSMEALSEMVALGQDIFLCTSPLTRNKYCIVEKYEWVEHYLGKKWIKKIIVTKDKTLIHADILVDDKPEITGVKEPHWEHVIFDQPYNRYVENKKRINWKTWKKILSIDSNIS
jgi:5'-nucleotidase